MKTIIFDFDGTIADTFKMTVEIAHNLTGHKSLIDAKEVRELKRESMIEVAERLDVPKYMWPFLIYRGRKQMGKRLNEIKLFSGMEEVLESLHSHGYRMFVMSSNSSKNINRFLHHHGLRGYFKKIYGGVSLLGKSGTLRKILKQNKLHPEDVIYVGDEMRDIESAKNVGSEVVAVGWGFNDVERLENEQPTVLVRSRPELLKVLLAWEKSKA